MSGSVDMSGSRDMSGSGDMSYKRSEVETRLIRGRKWRHV